MKISTLALALALSAIPAGAQATDPDEKRRILSAALAEVRDEFPMGIVMLDVVVADTTKRLAPALLSRKEHPAAVEWAKPNRVEVVNTEAARPTCLTPNNQCEPAEVAAAIGLSEPVVRGDSARVIARTARYDGTPAQHLRITVEELILRQIGGEWKVQRRKVKAVS